MKARDIMTSNPHACHPNDKLCSAINIMKKYNCGSVPVTDGAGEAHLVGIITDRDVALNLGEQEKACSAIEVGSSMNKQVYFCNPDDDLSKVEQIMKEHKIHRVPVATQDGTLQGIIALADLAKEANREKKEGRRELPELDLAEIVEEISTTIH